MKKMLCLLLVLVLLVPTAAYATEDKPVQVMLNGSYLEFDVQPANVNDRLMLPFRAIAEKLDATVEFNDKTRQILATKGEHSVVLTIDQTTAEITNRHGTKTQELDAAPIILEDRTLVPLRFLAEAFEIEVGWDYWEETAVLVDYSYFVDRIKSENANFYKAISLAEPAQNFRSRADISFDLEANSKTFGVDVFAANDISIDFKQDGNKAAFEVNLINDGLYNLITFFIHMNSNDWYDEKDENFEVPDFDKPLNIQFMMRDNAVYVKSEFIFGMMLDSYTYSYLDKEYIDSMKSKWFKLSTVDENIEIFQFDDMSVDERLDFLLRGVLPNLNIGYYSYTYKNSISYFEDISRNFNIFTALIADEHFTFTDNEDGSVKLAYTLDDKVIYQVVRAVFNDAKDESEIQYIDKFFELFHLDLTSHSLLKDGVTLESGMEAIVRLDNIPNPYQIQIAAIDAVLTAESAGSEVGEVTIADSDFPLDFIDQEQLDRDALQARIKYYTDQGYQVDEYGNIDWSSREKE